MELEYKNTNRTSHIEGTCVRVPRTLTIFTLMFCSWEDKVINIGQTRYLSVRKYKDLNSLQASVLAWRREWQHIPVFLHGESPWTEEPGGL